VFRQIVSRAASWHIKTNWEIVMNVHRLKLIGLLLTGTWFGVAHAQMGHAQMGHAQNVTIGVLTDLTGPSRDMNGPGSVAATQMAVEDFGGNVLGRSVTVLVGDHLVKPDIGSAIAREWYDSGVDLIVDVPVSAVGLAVQAVSKEKKKLLITTATLTSDFTSKFCTPYSMQWAFNTTALASATAHAALANGLKRWFFLTADYAFGHSMERDATKVLLANGGSVAGSISHPFNSPDMTSFVVGAMASDAQAIALASGPPDNVTAIKQAGEFGLATSGKTMVGLFTGISDVRALGLPAAQGLVLTEAYYWDANDAARAFAQRFFARIHAMPTSVQAADYSATLHWLNAVKAAGTTEPGAVAEKMRATPVEDMFAHNGTLRRDGLMVHDLMLVKVKSPAESKGPWDVYDVLSTVPGNSAFPRVEDEECAMAR
jgi:branched-chain amino acid transport system substrate-binding protein